MTWRHISPASGDMKHKHVFMKKVFNITPVTHDVSLVSPAFNDFVILSTISQSGPVSAHDMIQRYENGATCFLI